MYNATLTREEAWVLVLMLESNLLTNEYVVPWLNELIRLEEIPPSWAIDLSFKSSPTEMVYVLREYVFSEPFGTLMLENKDFNFIACLFLRFKYEGMKWGDFLKEAGGYADGAGHFDPPEYFYTFYTNLVESECAEKLQFEQVTKVERDYTRYITDMERIYLLFHGAKKQSGGANDP